MASLSRRLFWSLISAPMARLLLAASGEIDGQLSEYDVKAAFVLNFIRFVKWPSDVSGEDLTVCTIAGGPLSLAVAKLVRGKLADGRLLRVQAAPRDPGASCSVLVVDEEHASKAFPLLAPLARRPVLTIGEGPGFLPQGGMLHLLVENRRVIFEANPAAIQRAGLDINSNLLRLARNLRSGAQP